MTRVDGLVGRRFDLLVVGGGIHGLFAACDAAQRGLSVALIDRGDFGGGLSFNHQRTLHGGLRALQHGNLRKARQQILERRSWARMAPHMVRPLPFLIGTYRFTGRSRWLIKAGFAVYDFVGRGRNVDVPPELHLPKGRLESAAATKRLFQGVSQAGLSGGAIWYDYQTPHPDRLTWTVALAAEAAGATLVNYVEAIGGTTAGGRVTGAHVRDVIGGQEFQVEASVVLLAAGAGLGEAQRRFGATGAPPLLRAMNLLFDRPARDIATAAPTKSGRMLTSVPWRGRVLIGTHQSDTVVEASETEPAAASVAACLAEANATFPLLAAKETDIRMIHYGLTPASVNGSRVDLLPEPQVIRHAATGVNGLVSLVGVKYTTSRWAAERAVDAVQAEIGRGHGRSATSSTILPHADVADVEGRLVETQRELGVTLDRDVVEHLSAWYGTEASDVVRSASAASLLDRLSPNAAVLACEVPYAVAHSKAVRLSDVVLRRTPLGSAGHPGSQALARAAELMTAACGWTRERRDREVADLERTYAGLSAPGR